MMKCRQNKILWYNKVPIQISDIMQMVVALSYLTMNLLLMPILSAAPILAKIEALVLTTAVVLHASVLLDIQEAVVNIQLEFYDSLHAAVIIYLMKMEYGI